MSRRFHIRSIAVLAAIIGALLAPGFARADGETSVTIDALVAVTGAPKPYQLHIQATHFKTLVNKVSVQLQRKATTGNKPTVFTDYTTVNSEVHRAADLSSCVPTKPGSRRQERRSRGPTYRHRRSPPNRSRGR
jgi:hypothetical protein